jgi:hypothetical protein
MNVGPFAHARVDDHKAIHHRDQWRDIAVDGFKLTPSIRLIAAPGHTREDATTLVGTADGVVGVVGDLWWRPDRPADEVERKGPSGYSIRWHPTGTS